MIAHGGDPEAMSVTQYLDLAYSVVVDERVRRGSSLFDALEATGEWAAGQQPLPEVSLKATPVVTTLAPASGNSMEREPDRVDPGGPGAPVTAEERANADAMSMFQSMMGDVGGVG